jgi:transcriptional regulator with XRE-family HTH domain
LRQLDGTRITSARIARHLSREQLAVAVGRSYHSVAAYESGKITPPANTLANIADALGCDIDALFTGGRA